MLKKMGFRAAIVDTDETLLDKWDMWRDHTKKKFPHPNMPTIYHGEGSLLYSAKELHKLMDDLDLRIMEAILLDGGYREQEE